MIEMLNKILHCRWIFITLHYISFCWQHIDKILKTKELETQLFDAKLQQANLHLTEEKELFLRDKQKVVGSASN